MKKHLIICLAMILTLTLVGCYVHEESISGTLIDDKTGAPISDAFVAVQWSGSISSFADSNAHCLRVAVAKTSEDGTFQIPSWTSVQMRFLSLSNDSIKREWRAYKPGYDLTFAAPINEVYRRQFRIKPFSGSSNDRLVQIYTRSGFMCLNAGSSAKAELPILDAIMKEVYALPTGSKPLMIFGQSVKVSEKIQYQICSLKSIMFTGNFDDEVYEKCRSNSDNAIKDSGSHSF